MQLENMQWTAVSEGTQTLIYCILILVYLPNAGLVDLQPECCFSRILNYVFPRGILAWLLQIVHRLFKEIVLFSAEPLLLQSPLIIL